MMLLKWFIQYISKFEKFSSGHRTGRYQFFIPAPERGSAKEYSKYWKKITLFLDVSRLIFKFFKLDFNSTCTENFQMYKLNLEKAEEQEIKLSTSTRSLKRQENSRKTSISALLIMQKPLTLWNTINCGKFWKRWEYQTTWSASWETYMQVRKQQLELDMDLGITRYRIKSTKYII